MLPHYLHSHFNERFRIVNAEPVGGGCINDCYKLITSEGNFFLKLNEADAFTGMFDAEANGLKLLADTHTLKVPEILDCGLVNNTAYLLMEFIETGSAHGRTMQHFAEGLAAMHRHTATQFGLDHNNYIGSLLQNNHQMFSWPAFFIEMRLVPQIKLAREERLLPPDMVRNFDTLFAKMDDLFPNESPALLHGDLWSGNYLINRMGQVYLVDPAVYYGHREMDIAMSRLFGGFSLEFYEVYNHHYPLAGGWQQRVELCNLYPLLVHVNLFGGSYVSQVKTCLEKFV